MDFIFLGILTFIASFIGTVTGFGSSTIMLPLVALSYPFPQTLLFVGIIHVANDVWKIVLFRHAVSWKLIIVFVILGFFVSIFGVYVALGFSSPTFIRILGHVPVPRTEKS
jgi:uncharacterized membrane protein YfcA